MEMVDYYRMFPHAPIISEETRQAHSDEATYEQRSEAAKKGWEGVTPKVKARMGKLISEALTGLVHSEEARENYSRAAYKREANYTPEERRDKNEHLSLVNTGKVASEETRRKMSESHKKNWEDPRYVERIQKSLKTQPNQEESLVTYLLSEYFPQEWEYTGNKPFLQGCRRLPDWTHTSKKKVIFYDGQHWHDEDNQQDRIEELAKFGYGCLIITFTDLWYDFNAFIQMIKEFSEQEDLNGSSITT